MTMPLEGCRDTGDSGDEHRFEAIVCQTDFHCRASVPDFRNGRIGIGQQVHSHRPAWRYGTGGGDREVVTIIAVHRTGSDPSRRPAG